jgi:hypothetical protein
MLRPILRTRLVAGLALGVAVSAAGSGAANEPPVTPSPATVAAVPPAEAKTAEGGAREVTVSEARAAQIAKMTCKTVKVTGSNVRTRTVCTTPDQTAGASDWVRQQQDRGAISASRAVNGGG